MLNVNVDLTEFARLGPTGQRRAIKAVAVLATAIENPRLVVDDADLWLSRQPEQTASEA